jgi:hypothetical protein
LITIKIASNISELAEGNKDAARTRRGGGWPSYEASFFSRRTGTWLNRH